MASPHSESGGSDVDVERAIDMEFSSSESEPALHEWEWAFAKDGRVDLIHRVPKSSDFNLVSSQWWKKADNGEPVRLNVSGKYCSSQKYKLSGEVKEVGQVTIMMYEHAAKNPQRKWPPVIIRSLGSVIVVKWEWTQSDDEQVIAVQYTYALSGKPFKVVFYDRSEQVTVCNALKDLRAACVREDQISKFQKIKNGYGLHPNTKMEWCRR
eukprot:s2798_g4.t1